MELLLLELLLVLLKELLVLLLDHQLLQGLGLATLLLGQRGGLGSSQGTVAPHKFGDGGRWQREATQTDCGKTQRRHRRIISIFKAWIEPRNVVVFSCLINSENQSPSRTRRKKRKKMKMTSKQSKGCSDTDLLDCGPAPAAPCVGGGGCDQPCPLQPPPCPELKMPSRRAGGQRAGMERSEECPAATRATPGDCHHLGVQIPPTKSARERD